MRAAILASLISGIYSVPPIVPPTAGRVVFPGAMHLMVLGGSVVTPANVGDVGAALLKTGLGQQFAKYTNLGASSLSYSQIGSLGSLAGALTSTANTCIYLDATRGTLVQGASTAAALAQLAALTATIRATRPDAVIVLGGTIPTWETPFPAGAVSAHTDNAGLNSALLAFDAAVSANLPAYGLDGFANQRNQFGPIANGPFAFSTSAGLSAFSTFALAYADTYINPSAFGAQCMARNVENKLREMQNLTTSARWFTPLAAPSGTVGILPVLTPIRTTGVAPLFVSFSTLGTLASGTDTPFADVFVAWDYGDAEPGTWATGSTPGASKNVQYGPIGGHVYDSPGTYTVTAVYMTGTDTKTRTTTITVQDPATVYAGTKTICYSQTGDFTGAPAGASLITAASADFAPVLAAVRASSTAVRVLCRAGETYTIGASQSLSRNSALPVHVGRFGNGVNPKIKPLPTYDFTNDNSFVTIGGLTAASMADVRWDGIDFDGDVHVNSGMRAIVATGACKQFSLLRTRFDRLCVAMEASDTILDGRNLGANYVYQCDIWNELCIQDCTVDNCPPNHASSPSEPRVVASMQWYFGCENSMFAGNHTDGCSTYHPDNAPGGQQGNHNWRLTYGWNLLVGHNTFRRAAWNRHMMKCHSLEWTKTQDQYVSGGTRAKGRGYTEWVAIADNRFDFGVCTTAVSIDPPSSDNTEFRGRRFLVERNYWNGSVNSSTQHSAYIAWTDVTLRNNVADMTGGAAGNAFRFERVGLGSVHIIPERARAFNNTVYSSTSYTLGGQFCAIMLDPLLTDLQASNNLAYAPNDGRHKMFGLYDVSATPPAVIGSNNSTTAQVGSTDPMFVGPLTSMAGFRTQAGSYARNGGTPTSNIKDAAFASRSATTPTMGAFEA